MNDQKVLEAAREVARRRGEFNARTAEAEELAAQTRAAWGRVETAREEIIRANQTLYATIEAREVQP